MCEWPRCVVSTAGKYAETVTEWAESEGRDWDSDDKRVFYATLKTWRSIHAIHYIFPSAKDFT